MNNILIIGNGFDLYHKLPTRYTDFLFLTKRWKQFYAKYNENISRRPYDKNADQIVVRTDEYGKLTEDALEDFLDNAFVMNPDRIRKLGESIDNNPWINYFVDTNYEKDGWIDFEAEIETVLVNIEQFFSTEVQKCENKIMGQVINPVCYKVISSLMNHTKSLGRNVGVYHKSDIQKFVYGDVKRNLIEELTRALDDLEDALDIYLEEFVGNINVQNYSEQIKNLGDINLLNFNYTYTYKTVYGGAHLNKHHQIHGSLQEKDIVLGISDDTFKNLDYIYFQKYFQRIQKRTGAFYREWIPKEFHNLEDAPIEVFIMGHSLGQTDKSVLEEFFLNRNAVNKITLFYHSQKAYEELVIALVRLFGKEFVIEETGKERIVFTLLRGPVAGSGRSSLV